MSDDQITIQEFKTWLKGAEEFQPEGWIPNEKQWMLIRKKINNLVNDTHSATNTQSFINSPQIELTPAQPQSQTIPFSQFEAGGNEEFEKYPKQVQPKRMQPKPKINKTALDPENSLLDDNEDYESPFI